MKNYVKDQAIKVIGQNSTQKINKLMAFINFISESKTNFQDIKQCINKENNFNVEFIKGNIELKRSPIWK